MPRDPFVREKFTRERLDRQQGSTGIFQVSKEQFQTELETWRYLPSQTIEYTMKRLIEPIEMPEKAKGK